MPDTVASLLRVIEHTRAESLQKLANVDPTSVIYQESGWRVKDIIGHLTDWDLEAVRTLEAFHEGGEYGIENFVGADAYNAVKAKARWDQPYEAIRAEWGEAHTRFKGMIGQLKNTDLPRFIFLPWHRDGSVRLMIRIMSSHEHEHINDIANA